MRSSLPSSLLRHSLARQALQQQRVAASKRFASTSTEAAQQKAQEALAVAQKNAGKVWESAQKFLGPLGQRAGNMLGSYRQPLFYNLAVTRELFKQIYVKEGLSLPSLATFRETYATIWSQITTPSFVGSLLKSGDIGRVGIYGLQAYGIFKIGEIVGRRHVVGYKLN